MAGWPHAKACASDGSLNPVSPHPARESSTGDMLPCVPAGRCDEDYETHLALMAEWCGERGADVWAYCLMPNHGRLSAVPQVAAAFRRGIDGDHRRHTRRVIFREGLGP